MSIREELNAFYKTYLIAYRDGDAKGCASVFAEDARLFSPYGSAHGRQAIAALHEEWVAEGGEDKQLEVVDAGQSGDMAWCLAHYSEGDDAGMSLNICRQQADGSWLIEMCSLNAR